MIATLVVQPPSRHEGGDLVVYRGGEVEHRHEFGKTDGTAAFFPHYAVHYADAEHAVEKVTKGFRLALVYSICLPSTMRHLKRDSVDSTRFRALEEANDLVPADNQLRFFIVKLSYKSDTRLDEEGWLKTGCKQALHWYTTSGEDMGHWEDRLLSKTLNFLNPGRETLLDLWKSYGNVEDVYTGNEGPIKSTKYSRFAVVAWPAANHSGNVLSLMSAELAVEDLAAHKRVDATALRQFLGKVSSKYGWKPEAHQWQRGIEPSVRFCKTFCELLLDANDTELVKLFFTDFCPRLGRLSENTKLIPIITRVVRAFPWSDIGDAMLEILGDSQLIYEDPGYSDMELLLQVASGLDNDGAQQALVTAALNMENFDLRSSEAFDFLWKRAVRPGDMQTIKMVTSKLQNMRPTDLGPFVEVFSQYITEYDSTCEQFIMLARIAVKRIEWLKDEVQKLDKIATTFSWEMPLAEGSEYRAILDFLRGPEQIMTIEGLKRYGGPLKKFSELREAEAFAKKCNRTDRQYQASYTAKSGQNNEVFVTLTKTRTWFDGCQAKLAHYQTELTRLSEIYEGIEIGSPPKQAHLEFKPYPVTRW